MYQLAARIGSWCCRRHVVPRAGRVSTIAYTAVIVAVSQLVCRLLSLFHFSLISCYADFILTQTPRDVRTYIVIHLAGRMSRPLIVVRPLNTD